MREQARLQLVARETQQPVFEVIQPIEPENGLCRLPEPSPRDLFLDLEGDPFAGEGGREYLFGIVSLGEGGEPVYRAFWAQTEQEERAAFDSIMSLIMEAWDSDPGMHVYHYAPYEPSAFKRLSCRYAVREQDVDRLLRVPGGSWISITSSDRVCAPGWSATPSRTWSSSTALPGPSRCSTQAVAYA